MMRFGGVLALTNILHKMGAFALVPPPLSGHASGYK